MTFFVPATVGDFFECRLVGFLDSQTCITTFRYVATSITGGEIDMQAVHAAFSDTIWQNARLLMSEKFINVRAEVQKIHPTRYVAFTDLVEDGTGAVTGVSLPSGAAFVFRRKLKEAGKAKRGRIYLPAIPASSALNSQITTAVMAGAPCAAFEVALTDSLEPAGAELQCALITPTAGGSWQNRGKIEFAEADPVIRYQRRREVGVGQ